MDVLEKRQDTHGDFREVAVTARTLKDTVHNTRNWKKLSCVQQEALDCILTKIARICSGNPDEPDHWKDIAGYASLPEFVKSARPSAPMVPRRSNDHHDWDPTHL